MKLKNLAFGFATGLVTLTSINTFASEMSYSQLSQRCSAFKVPGADGIQGDAVTGGNVLVGSLPEIVVGLVALDKVDSHAKALYLDCLLSNGLESNAVGGDDFRVLWESPFCRAIEGSLSLEMAAVIAKQGGLPMDQKEKMEMLFALSSEQDDPFAFDSVLNRKTFVDRSGSCKGTASNPAICPASGYHTCTTLADKATFGDLANAAIANNNNKILKHLLSQKMTSPDAMAKVDLIWSDWKDDGKISLLAEAVRVGNLEAVKILIASGAKLDLSTKWSTSDWLKERFLGETLLEFTARRSKDVDGKRYAEIQNFLNSQLPWYKRWL